jgi:hypothetical protein
VRPPSPKAASHGVGEPTESAMDQARAARQAGLQEGQRDNVPRLKAAKRDAWNEARVGFGRITALHHRSAIFYQVAEEIRLLCF